MGRYIVTLTDGEGIVIGQYAIDTDSDVVFSRDESADWVSSPLYFDDEFGKHIKHDIEVTEKAKQAMKVENQTERKRREERDRRVRDGTLHTDSLPSDTEATDVFSGVTTTKPTVSRIDVLDAISEAKEYYRLRIAEYMPKGYDPRVKPFIEPWEKATDRLDKLSAMILGGAELEKE